MGQSSIIVTVTDSAIVCGEKTPVLVLSISASQTKGFSCIYAEYDYLAQYCQEQTNSLHSYRNISPFNVQSKVK